MLYRRFAVRNKVTRSPHGSAWQCWTRHLWDFRIETHLLKVCCRYFGDQLSQDTCTCHHFFTSSNLPNLRGDSHCWLRAEWSFWIMFYECHEPMGATHVDKMEELWRGEICLNIVSLRSQLERTPRPSPQHFKSLLEKAIYGWSWSTSQYEKGV